MLRSLFKKCFTLIYRLKTADNILSRQNNKPCIWISTYQSYLQLLTILLYLSEKTVIVISPSYLKGIKSIVIKLLHPYFIIDESKPYSVRNLLKIINTGQDVLLFPEVEKGDNDQLIKIRENIAFLALNTDSNIVLFNVSHQKYGLRYNNRVGFKHKLFAKHKLVESHIDRNLFAQNLKHKSAQAKRKYTTQKIYEFIIQTKFETENYKRNIIEFLLESRKLYGGKTIIVEDINLTPLSYNQLIIRMIILAQFFRKNQSINLKKPLINDNIFQQKFSENKYIGILLPTISANLITLLALKAISYIPAELNFTTSASNIISTCHTAKIKLIITSTQFIKKIKKEELIKKLEQKNIYIFYLEDLKNKISKFDRLKGFILSFFAQSYFKYIKNNVNTNINIGKNDANTETIDPLKEIALVLFTSGTEAEPKGVALSHSNIVANCLQVKSRLSLSGEDITFNALPMFHSFGCVIGTLLPVLFGLKTFLYPSPVHYKQIPKIFYRKKATILLGSSSFFNQYADHAQQYHFSKAKYIVAGAEPLLQEVKEKWGMKLGKKIYEGYGATECSPVISLNDDILYKDTTVGIILPQIKYELKNIKNIHQGGELVVSGPNVMLGYILANNPGIVQPLKNGKHYSGDICCFDENGFLSIVGRIKRFAKIKGEMVSLHFVEEYVSQLWNNYTNVALSIKNQNQQENIIIATNNSKATLTEILNYAKNNAIANTAKPSNILIFDHIPILINGKIDYRTVENMAYKALNLSKYN